MKKDRHYLVIIDTTIGEYEVRSKHVISTSEKIDKYLHEYMLEYWGDSQDKNRVEKQGDTYHYNHGEIAAECVMCQELPQEHAELMKQYHI